MRRTQPKGFFEIDTRTNGNTPLLWRWMHCGWSKFAAPFMKSGFLPSRRMDYRRSDRQVAAFFRSRHFYCEAALGTLIPQAIEQMARQEISGDWYAQESASLHT